MRGLEGIRQAVMRGLRARQGPVVLALALFAMGIVFGALAVGALGERDKQELLGAATELFRTLGRTGPPVPPAQALARSLGTHLKSVVMFWVLGVTVVGSLGALGLTFMRGFATGFAAGFLGAEMGWRGVAYAAAALLPHGLLAVPALLLATAGAVHFSLQLLQGRIRQSKAIFYRELGRYSLWMLGAMGLLTGASFVEAYVTPQFMRLVALI